MVILSGCDKEEEGKIIDWYPVNLYIKVTDAQGTDLLNPDNPNNMIEGTTITFKGKTYEASRECYDSDPAFRPQKMMTRMYMPTMYGLQLFEFGDFRLKFGEIDGGDDMDEDLVVTLPDGTTGTIHYHCSDHNYSKGGCKRSWKFNGKKHEGNIFTFIVSK